MKIGILFSKIRVEEKLLIEEMKKRRNVTLKLIDSRKLIINPEDNLGIDVLLDREIAGRFQQVTDRLFLPRRVGIGQYIAVITMT